MKATAAEAPLGVFDSGVGGLTVVQAITELLPNERVIYLGDTARVPYGNKSPDTVKRFARQDAAFLLGRGVKAVVVACNTATAFALPSLVAHISVPVVGVLAPGVETALARTRSGRIGLIGTAGTIGSEAYQKAIRALRPDAHLVARPTPLLVPLVEEDWLQHAVTRQVLEEYVRPMLREGIDTLVLACTHYPLLKPLLAEIAGPDVALVDSATTCAAHLQRCLDTAGLAAPSSASGGIEIFLTDRPAHFESMARRFLKSPIHRIEVVSLPE